MTDSICEHCNNKFQLRLSDKNRGRGRFCSKSCAASGTGNSSYRHGQATRTGQSREYRSWAGVKNRVTVGNALNRKYYLERGIIMCDRWFNSFDNFLEDMGFAPSDEHSIDRINPDGNYEPSNCRWATRKEQMNNTRSNKLITFRGETLTQSQWADKVGINQTAICKRLKRGWSIEKALTTT